MTKLSIGVGIAGVVVGLLLSAVLSGGANLGGVYNQVNNTFREGIKIGSSDQFAIDADGDVTTGFDVDGDGLFSGGTLTVTTSNSATSTITGGCFQFYATSTATALKFQASTTPGIMYSQYGSCPTL